MLRRNTFPTNLLCFCLLFLSSLGGTALARDDLRITGFGQDRFFLSDNSQPNGFAMVRDPADASNRQKVYRFSVRPSQCIGGDCQQQSARSSLQQGNNVRQPEEAWYGWDIYFPAGFPTGDRLISGLETFNEWKDQDQCDLVSLSITRGQRKLVWHMEAPTGKAMTQFGGDCRMVFEKPVASVSDLVGSWHRFELFARWSGGADGRFVLYLDGKAKVDYSGRTCNENSARNYHLFGNYLCCTPDSTRIAESTVYYRFISRASSRAGLKWGK